jgi:hypothetical protein
MCVTCVDGCIGMCEIGKSAFRGHEVIYPQPFGSITTAGEKEYPVDYSHLTIMGTAVGAHGIEADSDRAIFPAVDLEVRFGHDGGLKFRYPWIIPGIGSTDIARNNWEGLAIGSAIAGTGPDHRRERGGHGPGGRDPQRRHREDRGPGAARPAVQDHQRDGYGAIVLQGNIEDTRLGVQEYAIRELGVECVELKWGQGAKNIGGEVKIRSLEKAQLLYERGYIVLPDPTQQHVIEAFRAARSGVRAALPRRHGHGGGLRPPRRGAPGSGREVHLPQDRRLPPRGPGRALVYSRRATASTC